MPGFSSYRHFLGLLLLASCYLPIKAQQATLRIEVAVEVLDSAGQPLSGAYGRLGFLNTKTILAFGISNDSGRINLTAAIAPGTDTLALQVSAAAHLPFALRIVTHNSKNQGLVKVSLKAAPNTLPNAVVVAPAQWQRGDTTFYRVSSFLQHGDKKLKDVLSKLPGFDLSPTKGLLFQGRPVDKITIEGEEIFADKLELMISSFPVHVLDQIQAIENQTDDKLLKGLVNDNKIFINLGLKKGKLSTAFGDGEIAGGTAGRYRLFPTLFGLFNAIKFGLILDYNSTGDGLSPATMAELYKGTVLATSPWPVQHSNPYLVNNLNYYRYISNRLFNQRMQFNLAFSRNITSKTEISAVFDRQKQETKTVEAILNGNEFLNRSTYNATQYNPAALLLKEQLEWNIHPNQNLTTAVTAIVDHTGSNESNIFIPDNAKPDSVRKQLDNKWSAYQLSAKYSIRKTHNRAMRIIFNAGNASTPQAGMGYSADYPLIFGLPSNLKYLHIGRSNRHRQIDLTADLIDRKKGKVIYTGIQAKQLLLTPENNMGFSTVPQSEEFTYQKLAYKGQHTLYEAAIYRRQSGNMGRIQAGCTVTTGWQTLNKTENESAISKNYWLLKTSLDFKYDFGKQAGTALTLDYNQGVNNSQQWNEALLPGTIDQFARNANSLQSSQELSVRWNAHLKTSKTSSASLTAYARRNYTPAALANQLQGFVQVSVDSLTRSPLNTYGISVFHTWSFTKRRLSLNMQGNYFNSRFYQLTYNSLQPGYSNYYQLSLEGNKTWKSKWMIKGNAGISFLELHFSSAESLISKVANLYWKLETNKQFFRLFEAGFLANQIFNNLGTANKATVFLADVYLKYHLEKKPFDISLRCDNLLNEQSFNVFTSGQSGQAFTQVPLIRRNVFVSVRLTF